MMHTFHRPPAPPDTADQTKHHADRLRKATGGLVRLLRGTPIGQGSAANLIQVAGTGAGSTANGADGEQMVLPYFGSTAGGVGGPTLSGANGADDLVRLDMGGGNVYIIGRRAVVGNTTVILPLAQLDTTGATQGQGITFNGTNWVPGGFSKLASYTTLNGDTTVTFSSIPSGYTHLKLIYWARGNNASATVDLKLTINQDTSYYGERNLMVGPSPPTSSSIVTTNGTSINLAAIAAASANGGFGGSGEFTFPNYTNSSFHPTVFGTFQYISGTGTSNMGTGTGQGTSAGVNNPITRLDLSLSASTFVAGCVFSLYGYP